MAEEKPKYDFYENALFLDDPIQADLNRKNRTCAPKIGTEPRVSHIRWLVWNSNRDADYLWSWAPICNCRFLFYRCNRTIWSKTQAPSTTPRASPSCARRPSTRLGTEGARAVLRTRRARQPPLDQAGTHRNTRHWPRASRICPAGPSQKPRQEKQPRKTLTSIRRMIRGQVSARKPSLRIRRRRSAISGRAGATTPRNWAFSRTSCKVAALSSATSPNGEQPVQGFDSKSKRDSDTERDRDWQTQNKPRAIIEKN